MKNIAQKLHKDRDEILRFCRRHSQIHVYGAGEVGAAILRYLMEENIKVCNVFVSPGNTIKQTSVLDTPVKWIDKEHLRDGDGIIIAVWDGYYDQILSVLDEMGVKEEDVYLQRIYPDRIWQTLRKTNLKFVEDENANGFFKQYTELDCLGKAYGTDKSSLWHNYLNKYEFFLKQMKHESINVLELGCFHGGSMKMWKDYFVNAQIYAVDIDEECRKYEENRCHVLIKDLSSEQSLEEITKLEPSVIIDDASHMTSHQVKAIYHLLPCLKPGGVYILEDLGTNFITYSTRRYQDSVVSGYEFCKAMADVITSGEQLSIETMQPFCVPLKEEIEFCAGQIEMISFMDESCVLVKKYRVD
ncbi:MAG: class I SAM-dependent methyltransferase [Muribaculum sp.]|nr:class I SAM-dependent methyltransferase [Muribaculum sp.]